MKKLAVVFLLLVGCGSQDNNHGLGFDYDVRGETGTRLRLTPEGPSLALVEDVYLKVTACIGLGAPGPLVVFLESVDDRVSHSIGTPVAGTYLDTGTVMVEEHLVSDEPNLRLALAHEFVHWVGHYNNLLTHAQQSSHESSWFVDCVRL
jgi:hypothetical protein